MRANRNIVWLVTWSILAAVLGFLHTQGYALYTTPSGQTLSQVLTRAVPNHCRPHARRSVQATGLAQLAGDR